MQGLNFEELLFRFRFPLIIFFLGLILIGGGLIFFRAGFSDTRTKIEIINENTATESGQIITAEISGSVERPGVYKIPVTSRIEDLLVLAGGFSISADRQWTDKYLNRAAKVNDGQKIYIPQQSDGMSANENGVYQTTSSVLSSDSSGLININTASLKEIDSLPGIGQVYGQSIIDHRPYSSVDELLSKAVLKKSTYEKIKDMVSIY